MNRSILALLAATSTLAAPALAQPAFEIDEIVVSANLEETEAGRTGASVTVVTEEDLRATGETRLVEFLSRLPGVTIRTTGSIGGQAGLSIRGASQNYVAVLVDGIDVTDPSRTQVAFDFGGLTTADGRVTIMMPHPERVARTVQNSWHPDEWGEDGPWMRMFRNARVSVG